MDTAPYQLVIGDKNLSSWSLRPWLAMMAADIPFEEINIRLRTPATPNLILQHSPSGKIPVLKLGDFVVWDSLAIIEFLAGRHPEKALWPADEKARAIARSVSAEMHSGFYALRSEMPMELLATHPFPGISSNARQDIARIVEIWRFCRSRYGLTGPYLFGAFSGADAMFAPVVTRFKTYGVPLAEFGDDGTAQAYCETITAHPAMQIWCQGAEKEAGPNLPAASPFP